MRTLTVGVLLFVVRSASAQTATFENLSLAPQSYQNGAGLSGSFASGGATFNNDYTAAFDSWSGWSYSNVKNVTTPGFGNQYAAFHRPEGGGDMSPNYAVAYNFSPGDATIVLPANARPTKLRITNTTYAGLSMRNGDAFAKKFGGASGNDADFFLLTVHGRNAANQPTGSVDFYLADYRFANNGQDYIVETWTTVDLTSLAATTSQLSFSLTSSDVGPFGMNTPAYFAADTLTMVPVPEPGWLLAVAAGGFLFRRKK